jgi:hypothetical protein
LPSPKRNRLYNSKSNDDFEDKHREYLDQAMKMSLKKFSKKKTSKRHHGILVNLPNSKTVCNIQTRGRNTIWGNHHQPKASKDSFKKSSTSRKLKSSSSRYDNIESRSSNRINLLSSDKRMFLDANLDLSHRTPSSLAMVLNHRETDSHSILSLSTPKDTGHKMLDYDAFLTNTDSDLKLNLDDHHLTNEYNPEILAILKEGIELDESIERLEGSLGPSKVHRPKD